MIMNHIIFFVTCSDDPLTIPAGRYGIIDINRSVCILQFKRRLYIPFKVNQINLDYCC